MGNLRVCLTADGLVFRDESEHVTVRLNREETDRMLGENVRYGDLDHMCEVVHVEISNKCNLGCDYCYVGKKEAQELGTDEWKGVLDNIVLNGKPFQLTFGGGEPTLRDDLDELAEHVRGLGVPLCMTTNGVNLADPGWRSKHDLKLFDGVAVSLHEESVRRSLIPSLEALRDLGIPRTVVLVCLRRYVLRYLNLAVFVSEKYGAELLLLAPKLGPDLARKYRSVENSEIVEIAERVHADTGVRTAVDALACSAIDDDFCMQKKRFCDVDSLGNMLPCSFVREPVGSLLSSSFVDLWASRGAPVPCPYFKVEYIG